MFWQSLSASANQTGRRPADIQMTSEPHDRSKRVLAALVREYIASGEPVASSVLVNGGRTRRLVGDRAQHSGAPRGRRVRPAAAHLGRAAFPPIAATASTWTSCSIRSGRAARPTPSKPGSGATTRGACPIRCCPRSRTWSRRRRATSASCCGRRRKGRCSTASSSSRSAPRACSSSSSRAAAMSSRKSSTSTNRSKPTTCARRPTT